MTEAYKMQGDYIIGNAGCFILRRVLAKDVVIRSDAIATMCLFV